MEFLLSSWFIAELTKFLIYLHVLAIRPNVDKQNKKKYLNKNYFEMLLDASVETSQLAER